VEATWQHHSDGLNVVGKMKRK